MNDFVRVLPEACLALTLIFVLLSEVTYYGERLRLISFFSVIGFLTALLQIVISYQHQNGFSFSGTLSNDGLTLFFKALFVVLGGLSVLSAANSSEIPPGRRSEFNALVLVSCFAMCLAAGSAELLLSFVALQTVNGVAFLLAGFGKRSLRSTEAAIKYLIISAVAGVSFLYAAGILFSVTHSLNIYEIHKALVASPLPRTQMLIVFMLFAISFGTQVAAFPLSLWAPDVIEGAPTPIAGFLSVGIPASGFAVAIRLFLGTFTEASDIHGQWKVLGEFQWTEVLTLLSGLTMMFGALLSLKQTSAKRMVGCLVVAQSGYYLMGLLVLDEIGVAALLYNLIVGLFSLVGAFFVLSFFYDEFGSDRLIDYKGALSRAVPECICLVLFLLCVVGVPPLPGFLAKFTLIGVVIRHNQLSLAIAAILATAISTITVSKLAFSLIGDIRTPSSKERWVSPRRNALLLSILVPMVFVGVFARFFLNWAGRSLGFIFW